ncbi:MAG TPA: S8 family serine peptidase [Chitinophagaceae bacterium]|nr:S8 family serine peptidase [Chitinophagaceae bacterium]
MLKTVSCWRSYIVAAVIILALSSCQKEKLGASGGAEECFVTRGALAGQLIDSQFIVVMKSVPTAGASEVNRTNLRTLLLLKRVGLRPASRLKIFSGPLSGMLLKLSAAQQIAFKRDTAVAAVIPDKIVALSTCFKVVEPTLVTWSAKRVGYGNGAGKTAWVIDTGIDFNHPDLNVDANRSRSFVGGVSTGDDDNGHGTHVAGIIGAKNNAIGMLGIASGATLVSVKVLDKDGSGKLSNIIEGLNYVATAAKAGDVVNLSVGDEDGVSEYLDKLVTDIARRGVYFAIAAGNDNKPAINYSPGRVNAPNVYTVSAIDSLDNFASFSNYGNDAVDFAAPGVRVVSTYKGGKYARLSGTSMAAPHVAGLLLLKGNGIRFQGLAKNDPDGVADKIAIK